MKLSKATIDAFQNLSDINQGIFIEPGNILYTMATNKHTFGEVKVPDSFPVAFCIYDLKKFLTIISVYENPEIEFHDKYLTLSNGRMTTEFGYADKSTIVTPPPGKKIRLPSVDMQFALPKADLKTILNVTRAMEYTHVALVSDGEKVVLECFNPKKPANRATSINMSFTFNKEFRLIMETDQLSKILLDDYIVEVSQKDAAQFKGKDKIYTLQLTKDSTYDK